MTTPACSYASRRALARVSSFVNPDTPKVLESQLVRIPLKDPANTSTSRIFWGTGLFETGTLVDANGVCTPPLPALAWSALVALRAVHVACVIGIAEMCQSTDVAFVCLLTGLEDRGPVAIMATGEVVCTLQTQLATFALLATWKASETVRAGTFRCNGLRGTIYQLDLPTVPGGIGALRAMETHRLLYGCDSGMGALVAQKSRWTTLESGEVWLDPTSKKCLADIRDISLENKDLENGVRWELDVDIVRDRVLGSSLIEDLRRAGVQI